MQYRWLTVFVGGVFSITAMAGDLRAPFELESSKVLPKGVWNPRIKTLVTGMDSKYGANGRVEPLAAPLNRSVTFGDLIKTRSCDVERSQIRSILNDADPIAESSSVGQINGSVNAYSSAVIPVLAYGISDRWVLAACVPVIHVDVNVSTGFTKSDDGQKFIQRAGESSSLVNAEKNANLVNNALQTQVSDYGYKPLRSERFDTIGDAKLVSKYQFYKDLQKTLTLRNDVTVPTGRRADPDKLVDVPTGDGQFDVGASVIYDARRLVGNFGVNGYTSYNVQLPDSVEKRVPEPGQTLTPDKEVVDRDLGDSVAAGASINYEIPRAGVTIATGYNFQYQNGTTYSGSKYSPDRYRNLDSLSPSQSLHSMTVAAGFSSVDFYRSGRFSVPFEATLNYSRSIAGRNVSVGEIVSAELVVFF